MRGHIAGKSDRYYVVVNIGADPITAKRRPKWHGSWRRKKDAERVLAEILHRLDT